jgi:hypothetical protein
MKDVVGLRLGSSEGNRDGCGEMDGAADIVGAGLFEDFPDLLLFVFFIPLGFT